MKVRFRSRISGAIIIGGMVHTIGMLILWALVFSGDYADQDEACHTSIGTSHAGFAQQDRVIDAHPVAQ